MMIYLQNRKVLTSMPKEVWTAEVTGKGEIICDGKTFPCMATYETIERADEVLAEMFYYYRNGKNSYIMPEK